MSKQVKQAKHRNRGKFLRYLKRDIPNHVYVEEADGAIKRDKVADLRRYFTARNKKKTFAGTMRCEAFGNTVDAHYEKINERDENQKQSPEAQQATTMEAKTRRNYQQQIPQGIMTPRRTPATRGHTMRYPDKDLWAKNT